MWGSNTKRSGISLPTLIGTGYIDLEIESLPLLEGTYDLTVALSDMSEIHEYDHWERRTRFSVFQHGIYDEGFAFMDVTWSQFLL
jgi:lipopolysaccharide transport system ATP-binding protein